MRVNFTGLYLIKFPNTESKKSIQNKKNILENEIKSNMLDSVMSISYRENIKLAKSTQNTSMHSLLMMKRMLQYAQLHLLIRT